MRWFKFEKENDDRWYVVLPEWEGDKADLEMVFGADVMLDIIAQCKFEVEVGLSLEEIDEFKMHLKYLYDEVGGAWYKLQSDLHSFEVWLCEVTLFVFGYYPKNIYICY